MNHKKKLTIWFMTILCALNLQAYTDSDLDGVDDSVDKCPNTPFMDIVDLDGCTKKSLLDSTSSKKSYHHFDFILGASYSGADYNQLNRSDTFATSLQADYYYKEFSLQLSASYYSSKESGGRSDEGLYDTFIGTSYTIRATNDLSFYVGIGALLPTYDTSLNNNNTDYKASVSFSYYIGKVNLFGGYSYTLIGDDNVIVVDSNGNEYKYTYQDIGSFHGGIGTYMTNKLYFSASYFEGDSIYTSYEKIRSASLYAYYTIDSNWFTTMSYARGLSDTATDNYVSIRLGYFF